VQTDRGFDRLVNFSDAVVAIALTLLVLPLASIPEDAPKGQSVTRMLDLHSFELFAFVLSFIVIAMMWRAHHSLFEHLQAYNQALLRVNELWLFTIIVVPFATELINRAHDSRVANGLYVGTLMTSSFCLSATTYIARREPELRHPDSASDPENQIDAPSWITSAMLAAVFALVVAVPAVNMWPLLILFLGDPIRNVLGRRRRTAAAPAA
jgi:uncharacterized membrane protein